MATRLLVAYINLAGVIGFEFDDRFSSLGKFSLVLRSKSRDDYKDRSLM